MATDKKVTDLNEYRRKTLKKGIDKGRRCLALANEMEADIAESVCELRQFAQAMGVESEQGKEAIAFAARLTNENASSASALRKSAEKQIQKLQRELERLTVVDRAQPF